LKILKIKWNQNNLELYPERAKAYYREVNQSFTLMPTLEIKWNQNNLELYQNCRMPTTTVK
jgi:hypothetical protein